MSYSHIINLGPPTKVQLTILFVMHMKSGEYIIDDIIIQIINDTYILGYVMHYVT